ncbi:MAG: hypothetical protein ABSD49_07850 [Candidatus Bathyarchaeia archaeon]
MTPRNKTAGTMCIVGGALLVVAGTTGMKPLLEEILKYSQPTVDAFPILATIFRVLIFIAALGGISVIIGGLLTFYVPRIGKLLVMLGAGLGLFGFMIPMSLAWYQGIPMNELFKGYVSSTWGYVLGIMLTIIGRLIAK